MWSNYPSIYKIKSSMHFFFFFGRATLKKLMLAYHHLTLPIAEDVFLGYDFVKSHIPRLGKKVASK